MVILKHFSLFCAVIFFMFAGLMHADAQESALINAMVLVNEGRTEEAINLLNDEIAKNPQTPDAHLALGMAYLNSGNYSLAEESLLKAVQLNPSSVAVHYSLAMFYEKERKLPKAYFEWKIVYQLAEDKNLKELARKHISQMEGNR